MRLFHHLPRTLAILVFLIPFAALGGYSQVTTLAGGGGVFSQPTGIAITPTGDLIVADRDHHQIKRVSPAGVVALIAGTGTLGDLDGAANVAQFKSPVAVAYDAPRNLIYVADTQSDSIRKIDGSGNVSTFAATGFADPSGLTVDGSGNVYVADTGNNKIKKITPAGVVATIAGAGQAAYLDGPALSAKFKNPYGLAITAGGVLYIADQKNHVIRKLDNGTVSTVAGTGSNGVLDGPALSAKFTEPKGIAFDSSGNLIVADSNNELIRLVTLGTNPTVSTIAGTGALGLVNGPPLSAKFREPSGIALGGSIYVADADNDVIRAIAPDATPTGLSIYPAGATLNPGVTLLLSARVNYSDGHMVDVSASALWSSSNTASATVSSIGLVSAIATGDAVITATSGSFNAMATIHVVAPDALPPDPALIAPPIDLTKISTVYETTRFLYEGTPLVQTGVAPGTIERVRAAVIRGSVTQRGGGALSGVRITILDHPEYGGTLSREDGNFDIAVNGGGPLTVQYRKDGYVDADRQVTANGNAFAVAQAVTLIPYDTSVTTVSLTDPGMKVARGTMSTDDSGSRRATLLFPAGTTASLVLADGSLRPMSTLSIRATESTIGPDGPSAMPASLPRESAYTYCASLTADEAIAAGATSVTFSQPVIFYLENFLNFESGNSIPLGLYDRVRGVWEGAKDAHIVQIVNITAGRAYLDVDGDGLADDSDARIGTTPEERDKLATLYPAGQLLWRGAIPHFTPGDFNAYFVLKSANVDEPDDATEPKDKVPEDITTPSNCCPLPGSVIEGESQVLGEEVPVAGTPYSLHYRTARVPGHTIDNSTLIPLSNNQLPDSVKRIELTLDYAGRETKLTFPAAPNQSYRFYWDGKDAYGRPVQGEVPINIQVAYVYDATYVLRTEVDDTSGVGNGWGLFLARAAGVFPSVVTTRIETRHSQSWQKTIGVWDARGAGFGGWTLTDQHTYDHSGKRIQYGNGERQTTEAAPAIVRLVAGNGTLASLGDGGKARLASLLDPRAIVLQPDGGILIGEQGRIRRVDPKAGNISTFAGNGNSSYTGENLPATQTGLMPMDLSVGPDGSVYVADEANRRVLRIRKGLISTFAGNGGVGTAADGGTAVLQPISPHGVAASSDGSVYVADRNANLVFRVMPDGTLHKFAGTGAYPGVQPSETAGSPLAVALPRPSYVALDASGDVYISAEGNAAYRVNLNYALFRIVGPENVGGPYSFDPASTGGITVAGTTVYQADPSKHQIRQFSTTGESDPQIVYGTGTAAYDGDDSVAANASFAAPQNVSFSQGKLLVADTANDRVRVIEGLLPGIGDGDFKFPSPDGSEIHVFDQDGRHIRTQDALTNVVTATFTYGSNGLLQSITDRDGNVTTVERNGSGAPLAIVAPGGQRTTLQTDGNGYLSLVQNPAAEAFHFGYGTGGLLTTFQDPKSQAHTFEYDGDGRLTFDGDPAGGSTSLARIGGVDDYTIIRTTAEGRSTRHHRFDGKEGARDTSFQNTDGSIGSITLNSAAVQTVQSADGRQVVTSSGGDPRFGFFVPTSESVKVRTPQGRFAQLSEVRTAATADPEDPFSSLTSGSVAQTVNGRTWTSSWNSASSTITRTTPANRTLTYLLDTKGRMSRKTVAGITPIDYVYNGSGLLQTVHQGSRSVQYGYDSLRRLTSLTDPLNRITHYAYDASDRVTSVTRPDGQTFSVVYDANSNAVSVAPPGRPQHLYTFTAVDLPQTYDPPAVTGAGSTQYQYNRDHQLTLVTRPGGGTVRFTYNTAGRPETAEIVRGDYRYLYEESTGHLVSATAPDGGTINYQYDGTLLTSTAFSGTVIGTISRGYNNDFGLTSETIPCAGSFTDSCQSVFFSYDGDKRLVGAGALSLERNAQNGLITGSSVGNVSDVFSYDEFGETASYTARYADQVLFTQTFVRDAAGRLTQKTETIDGRTSIREFTYDNSDRLSDVTSSGSVLSHYDYDANGNRTAAVIGGSTVSASCDAQDRLIAYGDVSYAYAPSGELSSRTDALGTTQYLYDEMGNLLQVRLPDGRTLDYLIDAQNRRVGRSVDGVVGHRWIYSDKLRPAAEVTETGDVIARFVYATRRNVPDLMIQGNRTYRIVVDDLGSPRAVVDVNTGEVAQRLDYDEFGNVIADNNPGFQPFGFAGGLYDPDTKLVRFGARDYDPQTGRWTTKDPIGFAGGLANLYGYVGSDPVNLIDPAGKGGPDDGVPLSTCQMYWLKPFFPTVDLNEVRVHPDTDTGKGTRAVTEFKDIYMAPGEYGGPETLDSLTLLGHEITHVEQAQPFSSAGWLARYGAASVWSAIVGNGDTWSYNDYEVSADQREATIRSALSKGPQSVNTGTCQCNIYK